MWADRGIVSDMDLFTGSNFVVRDLRPAIDALRSLGYPHGWRGAGLKHSKAARKIKHAELHQTAGGLTVGEEGPLATARFCTANPWFKCIKCSHVWEGTVSYPHTGCPKCGTLEPRDLGRGRGFPKMPYHLFVPYRPRVNEARLYIVYLCLDWNERSWHSNAEGNEDGVACAFQGLFRSHHNPAFLPRPGTNGEPSAEQQAILRPLWYEYLRNELGLPGTALKGHYQFGKPTCPGDWLEGAQYVINGEQQLIVQPKLETAFPSWTLRQQALVNLGFDLGQTGPNHDGVDDDPGYRTRMAIESFQRLQRIEVTGDWNADTDLAISLLDPLPSAVKQEVAALPKPEASETPTPDAPRKDSGYRRRR